MKVLKQFYCIQEKKSYKVGSEYKGKRKDLKDLVDYFESKESANYPIPSKKRKSKK